MNHSKDIGFTIYNDLHVNRRMCHDIQQQKHRKTEDDPEDSRAFKNLSIFAPEEIRIQWTDVPVKLHDGMMIFRMIMSVREVGFNGYGS